MPRLALFLTALTGCAGLRLVALRAPPQRAGSPAMAIGDVPVGFLGEDQLGDWVSLKKSTALGAAATVGMPEAAVALLSKVQADSQSITFDEVISMIDSAFDVSPTQASPRTPAHRLPAQAESAL